MTQERTSETARLEEIEEGLARGWTQTPADVRFLLDLVATLKTGMFDLANSKARDEPTNPTVEAFQILEDEVRDHNALRRRVFEMELALDRVRGVATRWHREADERGPDDMIRTQGAADMILCAIKGPGGDA